MEEHKRTKLSISDKKKADKIHARMVKEFARAVDAFSALGGGDHIAAQNYAVHILLRTAAHAAAWNAYMDGREPRPDYWDTVCKDALEKAISDLKERGVKAIWTVILKHNDNGEWEISQP